MSGSSDVGDLPHDNIQWQAIALIFAFPAAATVALALRIYSRFLIRAFAIGMILLVLVVDIHR